MRTVQLAPLPELILAARDAVTKVRTIDDVPVPDADAYALTREVTSAQRARDRKYISVRKARPRMVQQGCGCRRGRYTQDPRMGCQGYERRTRQLAGGYAPPFGNPHLLCPEGAKGLLYRLVSHVVCVGDFELCRTLIHLTPIGEGGCGKQLSDFPLCRHGEDGAERRSAKCLRGVHSLGEGRPIGSVTEIVAQDEPLGSQRRAFALRGDGGELYQDVVSFADSRAKILCFRPSRGVCHIVWQRHCVPT